MSQRLRAARVVGAAVALACLPVRAQIYRCPNGAAYLLQQAPCAGLGQSGGRLLVLPNGRPAPAAAATGASAAPRQGRVLGRTPRPASELAEQAN